MATPEHLAGAPTASIFTYCSECGQENFAHRGACVMCFTVLHQPGSGLPCPQCGTDNPKDAQFCQNSGTALGGKAKPKTISEAALAVLHGGVAALTADGEEDEEGFYEEEDEGGGFLAGAPVEPTAPAPPPVPVAPPPAPAPPVYAEEEDLDLGPKVTLDGDDAPAPVAAAVAEGVLTPDEDEMADLFAAPPPPPAVDDEEDFAPPPPPGIVEEEDFAPPPPPGVDDEDDFAPPPPALEEDEVFATPAAAPAAPAPAAEAPAPPAAPDAGEDEDFGDWSLDMEGDKSSSS